MTDRRLATLAAGLAAAGLWLAGLPAAGIAAEPPSAPADSGLVWSFDTGG